MTKISNIISRTPADPPAPDPTPTPQPPSPTPPAPAPTGGDPQPPADPAPPAPPAPDPAPTDPLPPDPNNPEPPATDPPADPEPPAGYEEQVNEFWGSVATELGFDENAINTLLADVPAEERLTPKALVAYTKTLADRVRQDYDEHLRQEDPRAYAYRLHRMKGGTDADFLDPSISGLPNEDLLKTDLDLQRQFYKSSLIKKGVSEKHAELVVQEAAKNGELENLVMSEFNTQRTNENKRVEDLRKEMEAAEQKVIAEYNTTVSTIETTLTKGEGLKINIPEAARKPFMDFVNKHITSDGEGLYVTVPLKPGTPEFNDLIQGMFFMYNRGDVSKLTPRGQKAQTGVKLGMQRQPVTPPPTPDPPPPAPASTVTIGSIWKKGS